ncbi:facilitated trehalose transporter Tret1-like [Oratosquilla oratoria]|uniref:facilitated trehalose transporter Tret1-like n=1 Tax=Oratosquilla oratoria TaxID=337810 RepID=UPI003F7671FE
MGSEDREKENSPGESPNETHGLVRQVICGLVISGCVLSHALAVAWPTVLAPSRNSTYEVLNIDKTDIEWIVAIPNVAFVLLPLVTALIEVLGPRRLLLVTLPPSIITWILMSLVHVKAMIYVGRVLLGFSGFIFTTVIPPLLAEITSPGLRGSVTMFFQMQLAFGILVMYVLAKFCSWQWATGACAIILTPIFMGLLFVPESPYWLVKKGRHKEALKATRLLRGPDGDEKAEVELIRKGLLAQPSTTFKDQFSQLRVSSNYKPVILVNVIMLLLNVGGQFVMYQYTVFIFQKAQVPLDAFTCSILIGVTRLVFTILSTFVVDRAGRRKTFVGALIVCALLYSGTSLSLRFSSGPSWVPVGLIVAWSSVYGLGISPTQILVMVEILPTAVRPMGCSLASLSTNVGTFVSMLSFPKLNDLIGMDNTFHIMAGFFLTAAVVVLKFVPESRGKTLVDMQEAFASEKSRNKYKKIYERKAKAGELGGDLESQEEEPLHTDAPPPQILAKR